MSDTELEKYKKIVDEICLFIEGEDQKIEDMKEYKIHVSNKYYSVVAQIRKIIEVKEEKAFDRGVEAGHAQCGDIPEF